MYIYIYIRIYIWMCIIAGEKSRQASLHHHVRAHAVTAHSRPGSGCE